MVTTRSKAREGDITEEVSQNPPSKAAAIQTKPKKSANTSRKRKEPASASTPHAANQGKKRKDSVAEQHPQAPGDRHSQPGAQLEAPKARYKHMSNETPHGRLLFILHDAYRAPAPLHDAGLSSPDEPTSQTVLAHVLNALLSSTRISHDIAARTVALLVRENYHDLPTLRATTWQQRTEVLTEGGYTHYREKTATELGDLAALLDEQYGGDASALLPGEEFSEGEAAQKELRRRLKAIKGMGDVGADIFIAAVQGIWPRVAPFLDKRSRETAAEIGLGEDVRALFAEMSKNAGRMAKLNATLTRVRLEKKADELKEL